MKNKKLANADDARRFRDMEFRIQLMPAAEREAFADEVAMQAKHFVLAAMTRGDQPLDAVLEAHGVTASPYLCRALRRAFHRGQQ